MARLSGTAARAEALLGVDVVSTSPVAGGDICTTTRLRLSNGRNALIKTRPNPPDGFFQREADGLRWLREAHGAAVVEVLGVEDECLIIEWIEPGRPTADAAEEFGRALAATHSTGADEFGAQADGYIGLAPLPNRPSLTWPQFYASRRVMPYVRAARDRDRLSQDQAAVIESLMERIHQFCGPTEEPSRIHGDLWSGNVIWSADEVPTLIDPAAHGGHRETDLAMLSLFGLPHLGRVIESYDEAAPLADGWRDRVGLHQLHPLLVHALLFGGSYGERAAAAARSVLENA